MNETILRKELTFLREQMNVADLKIARLENALEASDERLEIEGLQAMLQAAQLERELLHALIMDRVKSGAVSLEATILEHRQQTQRAVAEQARHWQRGHPTPPGYWETQTKQAFLSELLGRYRAWKGGHPYYLPPNGKLMSRFPEPEYAHPWYPVAPQAMEQMPERTPSVTPLTPDTLAEALERAGCHPDHLTLVAESDGFVLATGYAHSLEEREQCTAVLASVEGVQELLTGIVIVDEARCPVCQTRRLDGRARHDGPSLSR